ncbi:MAG: YciI family protein [Hyphomicrobiales bacterium]
MQFSIFIYDDESRFPLSETEMTAFRDGHTNFQTHLEQTGKLINFARLAPTKTAMTLAKDGSLNQGPFAQTNPQYTGYYSFEAKDMDAAVALAKMLPPCEKLEIRPILFYEDAH